MPDAEQQIRILIEEWAAAVHRGDLNGVVADHSDDIVMFDVPPPENRLRLTLGLRTEQGRWVVSHEHHSFPYEAG